jgi:hypothetical protein
MKAKGTIKAIDALILWNSTSTQPNLPADRQCRVVRVIGPERRAIDDQQFDYSSGAVFSYWRELKGDAMLVELLLLWIRLVHVHDISPAIVTEEFAQIEEFNSEFSLDVLLANVSPISRRRPLDQLVQHFMARDGIDYDVPV